MVSLIRRRRPLRRPRAAAMRSFSSSGPAQVGEGVFKLGGAPAHTPLRAGCSGARSGFDVALFGDIAVQRDEPRPEGLAAQQQDRPFGRWRSVTCGEKWRAAATRGDLHFPVAGAVFAALGVVADEAFERRADTGQLVGKFEQLEEGRFHATRRKSPSKTVRPWSRADPVRPATFSVARAGGAGRSPAGGIGRFSAGAGVDFGCNDSLHSANSCKECFAILLKKASTVTGNAPKSRRADLLQREQQTKQSGDLPWLTNSVGWTESGQLCFRCRR